MTKTTEAETTGVPGNVAFRDLCLALEAKDTKGVEAILDAKWRGKESDKDQP